MAPLAMLNIYAFESGVIKLFVRFRGERGGGFPVNHEGTFEGHPPTHPVSSDDGRRAAARGLGASLGGAPGALRGAGRGRV